MWPKSSYGIAMGTQDTEQIVIRHIDLILFYFLSFFLFFFFSFFFLYRGVLTIGPYTSCAPFPLWIKIVQFNSIQYTNNCGIIISATVCHSSVFIYMCLICNIILYTMEV